MAILKEQLLQKIKNNSSFQNLQNTCFFEIVTDDGTSSSPSSPDSSPDETITFDATDPNLACCTYTVNEENKTVEVTDIDYDAWYTEHGNYDVVIPATLGNYTTVLLVE